MQGQTRPTVSFTQESFARWRAAHAEALRLAQRLRDALVVFRQYAGELKYHPQTGLQGHIGGDLISTTAAIREMISAVGTIAGRWDEEITWLRSLDAAMPVDAIQRGHATAREAVRLLKATLDVFDRAVLEPESASLDAPYGNGAPRRVHPGAQCTWVAERAEGLARELSNVSLLKENLLFAIRPSSKE